MRGCRPSLATKIPHVAENRALITRVPPRPISAPAGCDTMMSRESTGLGSIGHGGFYEQAAGIGERSARCVFRRRWYGACSGHGGQSADRAAFQLDRMVRRREPRLGLGVRSGVAHRDDLVDLDHLARRGRSQSDLRSRPLYRSHHRQRKRQRQSERRDRRYSGRLQFAIRRGFTALKGISRARASAGRPRSAPQPAAPSGRQWGSRPTACLGSERCARAWDLRQRRAGSFMPRAAWRSER
jgi:hypothetical protein